MLSTHSSQKAEEPPNVPRPIPDPLTASGDAAAFERVPQETLHVIDQLFPRPTSGIAFLALLLQWAKVRQYAHGLGETHDVAVITVQSIRVLAKLIGWSYETTHKYVVLFIALGLLSKHRINGKIELHFSLHRYEPPLDFKKLDTLIADARHKVAVCANRVKQRYLVLYGRSSPPVSSPAHLSAPLVSGSHTVPSPFAELDATIHQVRELLQQNGTESFRPQLGEVLIHLLHLRGLLALPAQLDMADSRRLSEQQSEESPSSIVSMATRKSTVGEHQVDALNADSTDQGRLFPQRVDSSVSDSQQGRLPMQQVDFTRPLHASEGRLPMQQVDSTVPSLQQQRRLSAQKSTFLASSSDQKGRLSAQQVDAQHKKVDSSEITSPNVNVSIQTIIDSLNVNVRPVAAYLQEAFGEDMQKRGYYHNLYRDHKDAQVWLVAALETLIGVHRTKTVRQPGKYFYDRCVVLHRDGIPPELHGLIQQYGSLSLPQIVTKLCKVEPSFETIPESPQQSSRSGLSPVSRLPASIVLHIPHERDRVGMSQQDARRVYHLVTAAVPGLRLRTYRQGDASYALLIDDGLRHPHQTWMYSLQECQQRLANMHNVRDLFQTDDSPGT